MRRHQSAAPTVVARSEAIGVAGATEFGRSLSLLA
jgi:hypothetical protein